MTASCRRTLKVSIILVSGIHFFTWVFLPWASQCRFPIFKLSTNIKKILLCGVNDQPQFLFPRPLPIAPYCSRNIWLHHQRAAATARGNSRHNRDWMGGNLNQRPAVREKPLLSPDQGPHRQMFSNSFVPFFVTCLLRNDHVPACEELSLEEAV